MPDAWSSFRNSLGIYGLLLIFAGGIHLLPLLSLPFYPDEFTEGLYIALPAIGAMIIGFVLHRLRPKADEGRISPRHGAVIVGALWLSSVLITAAPYLISGRLSFTQAFFEGMNVWTTTGMTFLVPDTLPHVLLLCRSVTCFFGGVGLICVIMSTISEAYGMQLYNAEGHADRLLPNLARSARLIMSLFFAYLVVGIAACIIAGMPVFDAVNHCLVALSTGGMSVRVNGLAYYDSFALEIITIILMILGATNFMVHMLLIKGKFRQLLKIGELRAFACLAAVGILLLALASMPTVYDNAGTAFRLSTFNVISVITTSGFAMVPYTTLPHMAVALLIFLMLVGGCAGSTSGGIKIGRIYLLYKSFVWNIKRHFRPEHNTSELALYYPQGKLYVKEEHYFGAANYVFLYLAVLFGGVLVLTAHGYGFQDSLYEFAGVMGTTGLSAGVVSPTTPGAVLWTMSAGMFVGRLEIIVVILALIQIIKGVGAVMPRRKGRHL
jgi:trk system potassium uptake protein TrkH